MARAYTLTLINREELWTGILLSKYDSLRCGIESSLISGLLYCSYSLWVGILIVIVRLFTSMEHLNYACHPWIFVYQTDASLFVLGHIGSYDQGVGRLGTEPPCNIMPWRTLFLWSEVSVLDVLRHSQ